VAPQAILGRAVCFFSVVPPDCPRLVIAAWAVGATDNRQMMPTDATAESVVAKRNIASFPTYLLAGAVCVMEIQTDTRHLGDVRMYCRSELAG
jgi:hypothetical protein